MSANGPRPDDELEALQARWEEARAALAAVVEGSRFDPFDPPGHPLARVSWPVPDVWGGPDRSLPRCLGRRWRRRRAAVADPEQQPRHERR